MIRFGIIGSGVIADFHARAIKAMSGTELVGCCAGNYEHALKFAEQHNIRVYRDMNEMLAEESSIDAVCICTPSGMHAEQAIAAMQAGKDIVIEKSMCLTLEEADKQVEEAESTGRKVCTISQLRTKPTVQLVKRTVDEGKLGGVFSCRLSMEYYRSDEYYASGPWRDTKAMDGGGALMNQGIHGVGAMRYIMGPVRSASAVW